MSDDLLGQSVSVWMATAEVPAQPTLGENTETDVCIVGAGIAGMTTAYLLAREGKRVVVLDDGPIAGGMTQRTTAHLVNALDDRYYELERLHGEKGARLAAESHSAAIDQVESIVSEESIDCDFERLDGYLFAPPNESKQQLEDELKAAHRAGLVRVEMVERAPIKDFDTGPALRFPRQAQFHPLKYLSGLAKAIRRDGGRIFTGTHASKIEGGERALVETSAGYTVTASAVVVATNTPVNDRFVIHTKQAPYITYVIGARVPRGSVAKALLWDTPDPYHYARIQSGPFEEGGGESQEAEAGDYDILIVGGEDHKTGQKDDANKRYAWLERWTRTRFPMIESVDFRWSGQVMEPVDGLAFIGRNPLDEPNVFIATGDSGNGMTHGTIAGRLLTDLIMGRENEWATLYDPSRITLRAGVEFAKENLNVAAQYTDLVTPGDVDSTAEIKPGDGAIIRRGLSKVAAYRDEQGALHERSAVCVHLGCIVDWNSKEKTWDCPCHGSRYDAMGKVIQGPANSDLSTVEEEG
ncbi:MAG TPA: FAD-dependent oxidoreductase [Pyrinomonadaceae bacterium]|jgi:glycine/D-amino acid oxidase-like deaminating enzyme/nitrite reductase/ring-hydroxylating ferredoxin subunit|nr:FAD-dependent oxidoreductase [Pyrinomonadaceae bacterium]